MAAFSVPKTKVKTFKTVVLECLEKQQKEINEIHRDIRKYVEGEVIAAVKPLEAGLALREANVLKRILIEKGIITEKEFIAKLKK